MTTWHNTRYNQCFKTTKFNSSNLNSHIHYSIDFLQERVGWSLIRSHDTIHSDHWMSWLHLRKCPQPSRDWGRVIWTNIDSIWRPISCLQLYKLMMDFKLLSKAFLRHSVLNAPLCYQVHKPVSFLSSEREAWKDESAVQSSKLVKVLHPWPYCYINWQDKDEMSLRLIIAKHQNIIKSIHKQKLTLEQNLNNVLYLVAKFHNF